MVSERTTVIIGGGLAGVATFHELLKRGQRAILLDSRANLAQGASYANGGMLTPSMPDPWNAPGVQKHLFASLFASNSAMRLRPSAIPGLTRWGLEFIANSTRRRHDRASIDNYVLADYSTRKTSELVEETGLNWDLYQTGAIKTFETVEAFE